MSAPVNARTVAGTGVVSGCERVVEVEVVCTGDVGVVTCWSVVVVVGFGSVVVVVPGIVVCTGEVGVVTKSCVVVAVVDDDGGKVPGG
ncbi:MAG: hypothetical protein ACRDZQ_06670 [Acidimicrobiales bacterium]